MNAAELHALPSGQEPYEGGFSTKDMNGDDAVQFQVGGDDSGVHLHSNVYAGVNGGIASLYAHMSPDEAFELAGALEAAARAATMVCPKCGDPPAYVDCFDSDCPTDAKAVS